MCNWYRLINFYIHPATSLTTWNPKNQNPPGTRRNLSHALIYPHSGQNTTRNTITIELLNRNRFKDRDRISISDLNQTYQRRACIVSRYPNHGPFCCILFLVLWSLTIVSYRSIWKIFLFIALMWIRIYAPAGFDHFICIYCLLATDVISVKLDRMDVTGVVPIKW